MTVLAGERALGPLADIPERLAELVRVAEHASARQVRQRVHQLVATIDGTTAPDCTAAATGKAVTSPRTAPPV